MPKLWNDTIEAHKGAVANAIMEKAAMLASSEGLHELTMARVAQDAGIGRATLYKYFSDVEEILTAWHKREIARHLRELEAVRVRHSEPLKALEAVLISYAASGHRHHGQALGAVLHSMPHVHEAHRHLERFVSDIITEAVASRALKAGASPAELARYALAAIAASAQATSKPAVVRLVALILRGLGAA